MRNSRQESALRLVRDLEPELLALDANRVDAALLAEHDSTVGGDVPGGVTFDQLGQRGKLRRRGAGEYVEHVSHRRGTAVGARQQLDDRNVERLRDRLEDEYRRIALPAFDLREVAFGRA